MQRAQDPMDTGSAGEAAEDKRQGLISVNDLNYILEPDLSVAVNATFKQHRFQQSKYKLGQNAICILNSGADYIDTRRSYLHFDVVVPANTEWTTIPSIGGLSFIKHILISSRSGDELLRVKDFNKMTASIYPHKYDKGWWESVGTLFDGSSEANLHNYRAGTRHTVVIPMYLLGGLFAYPRLLPSMIMSGLRIDIEFEDGAISFLDTNSNAPVNDRVGLENIYFNLKSIQLTDAAQRALNELSATNGLELVYHDCDSMSHPTAEADAYVEVRRACSRALKAFVSYRNGNTLVAVPPNVTSYQFQLGSLYFPQQPIRAERAENLLKEVAFMNMETHGCLVPSSGAPYTLTKPVNFKPLTPGQNIDFDAKTEAQPGNKSVESYTIACNLERSSLFNLSGIPINNSRILSFRSKSTNVSYTAIDTYLIYVKLARVFLNNVEIEQ